ncbi:MAG: hypothetical protein WC686_00965 [Candidatus Shapirobacteria bacterium]|jgi:hypothetical protein
MSERYTDLKGGELQTGYCKRAARLVQLRVLHDREIKQGGGGLASEDVVLCTRPGCGALKRGNVQGCFTEERFIGMVVDSSTLKSGKESSRPPVRDLSEAVCGGWDIVRRFGFLRADFLGWVPMVRPFERGRRAGK